MPYIKPERRTILDMWIGSLLQANMPPGDNHNVFLNDGDVNYAITRIVAGHCFEPPLNPAYQPSYEDYQRAIGILECAKLELYRMAAVPYEERKRQQNGEVLRARGMYSGDR